MNTKVSVFVICVEAIIYLLLHDLHDGTFIRFFLLYLNNASDITLSCNLVVA